MNINNPALKTNSSNVKLTVSAYFSDKMQLAYDNFDQHGPRFLFDNLGGKCFSIEDAEILCGVLQNEGNFVEPYDFPKTTNVWRSEDRFGVPYYLKATKELLVALAEYHDVDYKSPKGFRVILQDITVDTYRTFDINKWGTHLNGVLNVTSSSPSKAVLELIEIDSDFSLIKTKGIDGGDFPEAPKNFFIDADGNLTEAALKQGLTFIKSFAKQVRVNKSGRRAVYKDAQDFKFILKKLDAKTIRNFSINYWGTKLSTCLKHFKGSPSKLVIKLIDHFDDFKEIKKNNLTELDFSCVPNNSWVTKNGRPTKKAKGILVTYMNCIARNKNVKKPLSLGGFESICEDLLRSWKNTPVNYWETTIKRAVDVAYGNSIYNALKDLLRNEVADKEQRKLLYDTLNKTQRKLMEARLDKMNGIRLNRARK